MYLSHNASLVTTHVIQEMKNRGEKIAMLTAYDYTMAKILDESNIDIILVGDSASNVMAGHKTTLPITLDEMIIYASSVVRAVSHAMVVVDMPFGTYQGNSKKALDSAIRIIPQIAPILVILIQNSENSITEPKDAPKPAQAYATMLNTLELGSLDIKNAMIATSKTPTFPSLSTTMFGASVLKIFL